MGRFKGCQTCTDDVGIEQLSTVQATGLIDQSIRDNLGSSMDNTKSGCLMCRTGVSRMVHANL